MNELNLVKAEAMAKDLVWKACKACGFEYNDNIEIRVLWDENHIGYPDGMVSYYNDHDSFTLTVYMGPNTTSYELSKTVLHEMAHIICSPYRVLYELYNGDPKTGRIDPETEAYRQHSRASEITARRVANLLKQVIVVPEPVVICEVDKHGNPIHTTSTGR